MIRVKVKATGVIQLMDEIVYFEDREAYSTDLSWEKPKVVKRAKRVKKEVTKEVKAEE